MIIPPTTFARMHYVYILKSRKDQHLYIGCTGDLRKRFQEHNAGKSVSTARRASFDLVYYEAYRAERDARIRERRLKQFKNAYSELAKRLRYSV
ncbi:MAG: GIY-YIG nuclease family protein [Patescibacteria group bacterium]